jgi:hypothetical protein
MVGNIYAEFYLVVQSVTEINDKSVLKNMLFGADHRVERHYYNEDVKNTIKEELTFPNGR